MINPATRRTAVHEAGHAVAHLRLGVEQLMISIKPRDGTVGRCLSVSEPMNVDDAERIVLSFCAGYAAVLADENDTPLAENGCDGDFQAAEQLIEDWALFGDLAAWKARAVDLISTDANKRATALLAEHLLAHQQFDSDYVAVLVELADGEITKDDFERYLLMRSSTETLAGK